MFRPDRAHVQVTEEEQASISPEMMQKNPKLGVLLHFQAPDEMA